MKGQGRFVVARACDAQAYPLRCPNRGPGPERVDARLKAAHDENSA
jgi:hypothetical protein